ncbi:MAG TPA: tetratricopeptide repeat protein [Vicinamibacterales bacterium]|nr:tetratricopeptide repeat protein [Vicinamibacterales bacterium]
MPPAVRFVFGPFSLDPVRRRLTASGEPLGVSDRQFDVLLLLVMRAGQIVSKDDLIKAAWKDVAVSDNSLEQAISGLRRLLASYAGDLACIETVARRGYRCPLAVVRQAVRESDDALEALLAPHRAFLEGRAALETLERDRIARARTVFEEALQHVPEHPSAHVGLANACVLQYEMTRADSAPDLLALTTADRHAREACRLDPELAEAWATLGFVLDRTGHHGDARAACRRAVMLEPDNWRHYLRLAYVSWGEGRLRAAKRALALLPGFPLAHFLSATVYVARQVFEQAERELDAALVTPAATADAARSSAVAVHWLRGLLHLAAGEQDRAQAEFDAELALEQGGHLYARECCARTWCAIGALRLRRGDLTDARAAFQRALERLPANPVARVGLAAAVGSNALERAPADRPPFPATSSPVDAAWPLAVQLVLTGAHAEAARRLKDAIAADTNDSAGWLIPIDPMLQVAEHPTTWADALALLRHRAA